jgi:hypothetical protein
MLPVTYVAGSLEPTRLEHLEEHRNVPYLYYTQCGYRLQSA